MIQCVFMLKNSRRIFIRHIAVIVTAILYFSRFIEKIRSKMPEMLIFSMIFISKVKIEKNYVDIKQ